MNGESHITQQLRDKAKRLSWGEVEALAVALVPLAGALADLMKNPPRQQWAQISAVIVMEKHARALKAAMQRQRIDHEQVAEHVGAVLTWWHVITFHQMEAARADRAAQQVAA